MKWNEMRYLYPAHMINQQHKEEVNHARAADCEKCEQMCKMNKSITQKGLITN